MAENRYEHKDRHKRERREQFRFDEDMRVNDEIDRRGLEEQRQREELRHRHVLVAQ